jgi:hypothetical protein
MSTRKTKKKRTKTSNGKSNGKLTGPVRADGDLYFSPEDLNRYELAQYKLANTMQGIRLKKGEAEEFKKKAEAQLGQIQVQAMQLTKLAEQQKVALKNIQDDLTKTYGVDFSKVTYDDESGRITIPPEDTPPKEEAAPSNAQN